MTYIKYLSIFTFQTFDSMLTVQICYNSALGVLRQDENRQPKIWKTLDIDPERQMLPLKEFRGRMTGTTPTFTQVMSTVTPTFMLTRVFQVTLPEIRPESRKRSKSASRIDRSSSKSNLCLVQDARVDPHKPDETGVQA